MPFILPMYRVEQGDLADRFLRLHLNEWQPDPMQKVYDEAATEYHQRCDEFDAQFGPVAGPREMAKIQQHAMRVLRELVARLGLTREQHMQLRRAIRDRA